MINNAYWQKASFRQHTAKVICKRFPQCVACPADNMARKPASHSTSIIKYVPGEVLQVDIKILLIPQRLGNMTRPQKQQSSSLNTT